jgi:hypothetical protein
MLPSPRRGRRADLEVEDTVRPTSASPTSVPTRSCERDRRGGMAGATDARVVSRVSPSARVGPSPGQPQAAVNSSRITSMMMLEEVAPASG